MRCCLPPSAHPSVNVRELLFCIGFVFSQTLGSILDFLRSFSSFPSSSIFVEFQRRTEARVKIDREMYPCSSPPDRGEVLAEGSRCSNARFKGGNHEMGMPSDELNDFTAPRNTESSPKGFGSKRKCSISSLQINRNAASTFPHRVV